MGIRVLGPSVNESGLVFTVAPNTIRFGLAAIKNVGAAAVQEIIAARDQEGPFRFRVNSLRALSLFELIRRAPARFSHDHRAPCEGARPWVCRRR